MIGPFFLQVALTLILLTLAASLLYFAYKKRSIKLSILEINSGNKDKNISLSEYKADINEYFSNLRYERVKNENTIRYITPTMLKHRGEEIIMHIEALELNLEGPTYAIEVLYRVLKTPASNFKPRKKSN